MGLPTDTEVFGFSENGRGTFARVRAALSLAGVDVDKALALMEALHEEASAANVQQEALKEQLTAQTAHTRGLIRKLYLTVSGYLDMAMAAVGKSSPEAKALQRVRSRIRRPDAPEAESTLAPNPPA